MDQPSKPSDAAEPGRTRPETTDPRADEGDPSPRIEQWDPDRTSIRGEILDRWFLLGDGRVESARDLRAMGRRIDDGPLDRAAGDGAKTLDLRLAQADAYTSAALVFTGAEHWEEAAGTAAEALTALGSASNVAGDRLPEVREMQHGIIAGLLQQPGVKDWVDAHHLSPMADRMRAESDQHAGRVRYYMGRPIRVEGHQNAARVAVANRIRGESRQHAARLAEEHRPSPDTNVEAGLAALENIAKNVASSGKPPSRRERKVVRETVDAVEQGLSQEPPDELAQFQQGLDSTRLNFALAGIEGRTRSRRYFAFEEAEQTAQSFAEMGHNGWSMRTLERAADITEHALGPDSAKDIRDKASKLREFIESEREPWPPPLPPPPPPLL